MGLLRLLARAFLVNRLFRGRRPPVPPGYPTGSAYGRLGRRYRQPRRGGVGRLGPFPYYSATTGRGTRVSIGGCCLPIPLFLMTAMTAASLLVRRLLIR